MCVSYLQSPGDEVVSIDEFEISKAKGVVNALEKLDYFYLLELRKTIDGKSEIIVFDTIVEIGQRTKYDILRSERIAVVFYQGDEKLPEVLALRENFPKVPHLNLREFEKPRSLCLFEEKYSEIKLRWTPPFFLRRIREWLAKTARGELHAEDQPLEPLLIGSPINLILPFDLFVNDEASKPLIIRRVDYGKDKITFFADWKDKVEKIRPEEREFIAIKIQGDPQPHGIISKLPSNILELHEFLESANIDLLYHLKNELRRRHFESREQGKEILNSRIMLILHLPKTIEGLSLQETDVWPFLMLDPIKEIGKEIGIWTEHDGEIGGILEEDDSKRGENLKVSLLNPVQTLSRERAAKLNGFIDAERTNILLVGCGALGSQIFMNLIRAGFGEWTVVDDDFLLPHNVARHALTGVYVGHPKAEMLAHLANDIIAGEPIAKAIIADILEPSSLAKELQSVYKEIKVILDVSASVPVARHLADGIESSARRISMFLNPSGEDAVILTESKDRKTRLDLLEMQYYRHLIRTPELENHLIRSEDYIRYARSCGDISSTISQNLVALHAAVCSQRLRKILPEDSASIALWKTSKEDMTVKNFDVPTYEANKENFGDWTLFYDEFLKCKILKARSERLPNETGGILIGSFDMQRKTVYVIDTILSPPDSIEWPTVYIRGCRGLVQEVFEVDKKTAGMLGYVGEWHSHPNSYSATPSADDIKAFCWLANIMDIDGLPALMVIAVKDDMAFYLGKME